MLRSTKSVFRVIPVLTLIATSSLLTGTLCEDQKIITSAPHKDGTMKPNTLYFTGTGIRKKRIVMIDVNVYSIDVNFGKDTLSLAKKFIKTASSDKTLVTALYETITSKHDGHSAIAINLKFLRGVSTTQIVEAFNDSFIGIDTKMVDNFKEQLRNAVGANGFATGDKLDFFWINGGGLVISVRGEIKGIYFGTEVEKRLLEVYIDSKRTVSPELYKNLEGYLIGNSGSEL